MQRPKFDPSAKSSWLDRETGTEFNFLSRTGGPGWSGAEFSMRFQDQLISVLASWNTPCGEYAANISSISLPASLLSERERIQNLIIEGVISFCAADYENDFSPKPFACVVSTKNATWKIY